MRLIDSLRFMLSSVSSFVDNLAEGLHNDKCKDCKSCLEYIKVKDELVIFKCSGCNKNDKQNFYKDLIKRFRKTFEFCNTDINRFCLMLRKGVCPCEYMNTLKRFN